MVANEKLGKALEASELRKEPRLSRKSTPEIPHM
jgi:hypothetical protein